MKINEIQKELDQRHRLFCVYIITLTEDEFLFASNGKWTAGQQLDHICRSTALLPLSLSLPGFVRRTLFGKPRRSSLDYNNLVKNYQMVLKSGGKASGLFIPRTVKYSKRSRLVSMLKRTIEKINESLSKYSEEELDKTLLPHPLLGKLTLREIMLFTIYHVDHHHRLAKKYLDDRESKTVSV